AELLGSAAGESRVPYFRGCCRIRPADTGDNRDGDERLDREDVLGPASAQVVPFEIQDPDAVAKSAHPLAHAGEARSAQVGTGADEGDDARVVVLLEHLPQGPAPEVDVVVVEVLEVPPQTAGAGGFQEVLQQSALAAAGSFAGSQSLAEAHPAAFTLDAVVVGVDL